MTVVMARPREEVRGKERTREKKVLDRDSGAGQDQLPSGFHEGMEANPNLVLILFPQVPNLYCKKEKVSSHQK